MATTPSDLEILTINNAVVRVKLTDDVEYVDFGDHIDNVALNETKTSTRFAAVSGKSVSRGGDRVQTIVLNLGQSLKGGSLWRWLYTNDDKTGEVEVLPEGATGAGFHAFVTFAAPAALGGARGANSTGATFGVEGVADIIEAPAG